MSYHNGPRIVTNGLVLYLDAGNNKSYPGSGTAWNDLSGNNNNGTLTNGPTFSSLNRGSIIFDGTNDICQTTYKNFNIQNKTIMAWVKLNSTTQQGGGLVGIETQTGGPIFDSIVYNETNAGWGFGSSYFNRTAWSNIKETSTDSWIFMCATYANNNYILYRNGIPILTTSSFLAYNFNQTARIRIGVRVFFNGVENGFLSASIPSVFIYSRVLSREDVNQNYNATKGRFSL
jgi:hypothetical protein